MFVINFSTHHRLNSTPTSKGRHIKPKMFLNNNLRTWLFSPHKASYKSTIMKETSYECRNSYESSVPVPPEVNGIFIFLKHSKLDLLNPLSEKDFYSMLFPNPTFKPQTCVTFLSLFFLGLLSSFEWVHVSICPTLPFQVFQKGYG